MINKYINKKWVPTSKSGGNNKIKNFIVSERERERESEVND